MLHIFYIYFFKIKYSSIIHPIKVQLLPQIEGCNLCNKPVLSTCCAALNGLNTISSLFFTFALFSNKIAYLTSSLSHGAFES